MSRPVAEAEREMSGIIGDGSNLSNEIQSVSKNLGITSELVGKIAQTFAWSIDFFRLHPGDKFKVIYNEKSVNGIPTGTGKIKALFFQHKNKEYYAFAYEKENEINYYDENGNSNKSLFLMAPLKFTRLSSPYTKRRFHPVQKRWKAHLGTDYAAPKGTPIWSTADGTVIAATYSRNNGYYVKIKQQQHLHHPIFTHDQNRFRNEKRAASSSGRNHWICGFYRLSNWATCLLSFLEKWEANRSSTRSTSGKRTA